MRRSVAALAALVSLTACTPGQVRAWISWHNQDPVAAEAFANQPAIQMQLHSHMLAPPTTTSPPQTSSTRWSTNWDAIARCESGGRWDYPPVTNSTGTYSGGLMIWQKAWIAYGGQQFASWAYLASKAEQIIVAERIWADRGAQAWDCA